jgi:hypothetical protein
MKIGVTGTRSGMNETQFAAMQEYLSQFVPADTELHHGDCVGVDVEVAILAQSLGMRVVCVIHQKKMNSEQIITVM